MSIFRRNPKNPLGSVIFTDATIRSISTEERDALLQFVDYCGSLIEVRFVGVVGILAPQAVEGTEVMNVAFRTHGKIWTMTLGDDDNEVILEISYENAGVQRIH